VVFAFHGYARALHQLLHGRTAADRFHVRGYREMGTTTTPFDMVVLNEVSRYHLVLEALHRSRRVPAGAAELEEHCREMLARHERYVREHFEDMPEVRDWQWEG
jgi:xylulose-5-phosphate/fructose-6-phosphate phosphoketolase